MDAPTAVFKRFSSKARARSIKRRVDADAEAPEHEPALADPQADADAVDDADDAVPALARRRGPAAALGSSSSGFSRAKKRARVAALAAASAGNDDSDDDNNNNNNNNNNGAADKATSSNTAARDSDSLYAAFKATGTTGSARPRDLGATKSFNPDADIRPSAQDELAAGRILNADDLDRGPGGDNLFGSTRRLGFGSSTTHSSSATRRPGSMSASDAQGDSEQQDGEKVYKGLDAYQYSLKKISKGTSAIIKTGPQRSSGSIRVTARFDYQPDVCKDYKETGYCGYGDSCIYLHDRSDYKTGWQLEKEWEEEQTKRRKEAELALFTGESTKKVASGKDGGDEKSKKELPFACIICRKPFTRPVVTKCGHYFCEACALAHHRATPKCFACGANTHGVFKVAKDLIAMLKERDERIKKQKEGAGDEEEDRGEQKEDSGDETTGVDKRSHAAASGPTRITSFGGNDGADNERGGDAGGRDGDDSDMYTDGSSDDE